MWFTYIPDEVVFNEMAAKEEKPLLIDVNGLDLHKGEENGDTSISSLLTRLLIGVVLFTLSSILFAYIY